SDAQRLQMLRKLRRYLNNYLTAASAAGTVAVPDLYRHALAWKGAAAARHAEDRLVRAQPELKDLHDRLTRARAGLARLAFAVPPPEQRDAWLQQLRDLYDDKDNLESELVSKSEAFRTAKERRRLGSAEVGRALPPGAVLVDLLEYSHLIRPAADKGKVQREQRLLAFLLRRSPAAAPVAAPGADPPPRRPAAA